MASDQPSASSIAERVRTVIILILIAVMAGELVAAIIAWQLMTAALVSAIMVTALAPILLRDRLPVVIPAEFHVLAILFVFAALFLGEMRDFYQRVWWWDIALHGTSGLLLGMTGFLLIYVLNENERANLHMTPFFIAFFAFTFAVCMGAVWEIFEFAMDTLFGLQMQKPMLDDPSGLTDTMWDLIVDAAGALVICVFAWIYMRKERRSFVEDWVQAFIRSNPHLFRRSGRSGNRTKAERE